MIDIKFEILDGMPCVPKTFEINGVEAFVTDFCDYIRIPSDSGYGCKSMTVKIDSHNKLMTMKKYKISDYAFDAIGAFLTSVFDLSSGCSWCE